LPKIHLIIFNTADRRKGTDIREQQKLLNFAKHLWSNMAKLQFKTNHALMRNKFNNIKSGIFEGDSNVTTPFLGIPHSSNLGVKQIYGYSVYGRKGMQITCDILTI
jgi:hypothetical protein